MIRASLSLFFASTTLAGCASTTSFAPPPISVVYGDGQAERCTDDDRSRTINVTRTVDGAYKLIDGMVGALRCAAHAAANGRQGLEIPAFVATTGGALAGALGGGAGWGLAGTAANAGFNAGNNYWSPKQKAEIYDHALDALLCVKTEAVGVGGFTFDQNAVPVPPVGGTKALDIGVLGAVVTSNDGKVVRVSAERRYFEMVSSAVFSVERILAHRLNSVGSVDASAVASELAQLQQQKKDAETHVPPPTPASIAAATDATKLGGNFNAVLLALQKSQMTKADQYELELDRLQPALKECVVRAKL